MEQLIETYGEGAVLFWTALAVGFVFGMAAQHSRFCLRSATVEFASGDWGPNVAIWLIAFCSAVLNVQFLISLDYLEVSEARQIAATGSLSGAVLGGLMFGAGMILARGCASRLLVLSATGNLRAVVTGLVLTLTAQAALRGGLAPLREGLSALWTIPGGSYRNLLVFLNMTPGKAAGLAAIALILSLWLSHSKGAKASRIVAALTVGTSIGLGWLSTYLVSQFSFEVIAISSITFTGPSADTLMGLVNARTLPLSFGSGLVPGVFMGALTMALLTREAKVQRFEPAMPMERYLFGAVLMGFGSMLAGGCAVGAGMSGGSVFALTAWLALFAMWVGAIVTHTALPRFSRRAV